MKMEKIVQINFAEKGELTNKKIYEIVCKLNDIVNWINKADEKIIHNKKFKDN